MCVCVCENLKVGRQAVVIICKKKTDSYRWKEKQLEQDKKKNKI